MNSPYKSTFRVSQAYLNPRNNGPHQGFDLVGVGDKGIYAPCPGTVVRAGWENPNDHSQGWGLRVVLDVGGGLYMYFGHLSGISVKAGQTLAQGDKIGIEGSTGRSTGSHLHWEIRKYDNRVLHQDISVWSGIPNKAGSALYINSSVPDAVDFIRAVQAAVGVDVDGVCGKQTKAALPTLAWCKNRRHRAVTPLQQRLNALGYSCGNADGIFGGKTRAAVIAYQKNHSLTADGIVGAKTWASLMEVR